MIRKTIKTYLWILSGYEFGHSFMFTTYVLFLVGNGLNLLEANLVNLYFMVAVFLFEIPTGAYADTLGRKRSFVLGCLATGLGFMVYFFSHNFWQFVAAELVLALAASLISGAFDAWLISSINYYGFNGDLKKVFGHKMWVSKAASATGSLIGACLGAYNLAWPWLGGSLILVVVSIIAGVVMKEEYFVATKHSGIIGRLKQIKSVAVDSVHYGLKEKMILLLMVLSITLSFSVQPLNMYWSVYFEKLLHGKEYLGIIWFVMAIFTLGGGLFSSLVMPRWIKKTSTALLVSYLITALGIIFAAGLGPYWVIITFFMVHEIGRGMIDPVTKAYLHD